MHLNACGMLIIAGRDRAGVAAKHFLVGACLCYGLQSQSPSNPHLHACVGMDCNPRVQGTDPLGTAVI